MNQNQVQPVAWYPQQSAYQQMAYNNQLPQLPQYTYQQPPAQQRPTSRPVAGRFIQDENEIRPDDVPMDGSVSYFPKSDLSCVVAKQWNNEGGITTVRYVPEQPAPATQPTNDTFSSDVLARLDKIQEMLTEKKAPAKREAQKEG